MSERWWREAWPARRLATLFAAQARPMQPELEVLSVYRDYGVVPKASRSDNFNRTPDGAESYQSVRAGDLVVNRMKAWQGSLGVSDFEGLVSPDYEVLAPTTNDLDPRFAHVLLRSTPMIDEYGMRSTGIRPSQWRLYWAQMRTITVPVPPLDEQRAIADYVDRETARIDTLIEEQQRLIEMLRERRDGVVTEAFLNSASEERKLKFAVDDVTVGIVVQPSRWYVDAGVPALRGINVKRGSISLADLVNISEEGHAAHPKSQLHSGDVVVVRTGQAGAAAKIPDELDGLNAIDILIVRPGEDTDSDFLVWYLNSPLAASRIEHGSVGALQGHFNVSALRELPLPDAPLAEQRCIVAYLDERIANIDTLIAETERFIELAQERRAALITAAVTGQIDVREMV
jgi:type I restriction enzyme, S subunit